MYIFLHSILALLFHDLSKFCLNKSLIRLPRCFSSYQVCIKSCVETGVRSCQVWYQVSVTPAIKSGIKSGMQFRIKSGIKSGIKAGLTSGIKFGITSGIKSGITSGI